MPGEHTAGKLIVNAPIPGTHGHLEEGNRLLAIGVEHIAEVVQFRQHGKTDAETSIANAERLTLCWNSFDPLAAALSKAVDQFMSIKYWTGLTQDQRDALQTYQDDALAAIAAAKPMPA